MNIQKAQKDIDSCRFCFMCRHICSAARATQSEVVTPRSRGLLLSYVLRGTLPYGEGLEDAVYECCLCGCCADWCQSGWNPPSYIEQARFDMTEQGLAPMKVTALRDQLLKYGVLSGNGRQTLPAVDNDNTDVLLYKGAYEDAQIEGDFKKTASLIEKAGIRYAYVAGAPAGFSQLYRLGYREDAQRVARQALDLVKASGAGRMATLSALDAWMLVRLADEMEYKRDFDIVPAVSLLMDAVMAGSLRTGTCDLDATYHDNDTMARYLGIIDQPRSALDKIGVKLTEMEWRRNRAHTTGGMLFAALYPAQSDSLVTMRMEEVQMTGAGTVVAGDIEDALLLRKKAGPAVMTLTDAIACAAEQ